MAKFIRRFAKAFKKPKSPAQQRVDMESGELRKRLSLARDSDTTREILYYLAEHDPDPKVRRAVVENESLPLHASPILAVDRDQDVRLALAKRLVDLLPELSEDEQSQLYAFAVQGLGKLALDEVLKVRVALSSTLKDHAFAPPKVAGQLARDVEREVSEPILRFCAALSDEDLLDILSQHPAGWVVQAIAKREEVSEDVSEAVIETDDVPAGKALLANEGALITVSLLNTIVEKAKHFPEWQKPMALRKTLPASVATKMAAFIDASVRDLLLRRGDFDVEVTEEISTVFRRRLDVAHEDGVSTEEPLERAQRLLDEGALNEERLSDALGMRDHDFVIAALAVMAKTDVQTVQKVMDMRAPKALVALCWRAGVSMRLALQLQKEISKISSKELLYPKDGTDFPLTQDEIDWQLDFLGLKVA